MSRTPIAVAAGLLFVFLYIVLVITIPDHLGPIHWTVQALYWCVAGILWVLPIRWLMLWSAHKR